jgi:hypothetical protein
LGALSAFSICTFIICFCGPPPSITSSLWWRQGGGGDETAGRRKRERDTASVIATSAESAAYTAIVLNLLGFCTVVSQGQQVRRAIKTDPHFAIKSKFVILEIYCVLAGYFLHTVVGVPSFHGIWCRYFLHTVVGALSFRGIWCS